MNAFHAYDIRGIYNKDFNASDVYKIGYFLVKHFQVDKVLVGRDIRLSSNEIFEALSNGITDAGANVLDCGLATTPMVYFGTGHFDFGLSVQITASHNSKEYNGLKISREKALPVGYDTGLRAIQELMEKNQAVPVEEKGEIKRIDVKTAYIQFLSQYKTNISLLNIAMDCSNGMAGLLVDENFGENINYLYKTMDGNFPNHDPNPLKPENVKDLSKLVLEKGCDIGVIFDGDADRVMFVDEKGEFISPDLLIALMGHFFLKDGEKAKVLHDIRTSKAVGEYLRNFNADMHMWRVGRAYAALKLREIDGLFGGELAGHYYFKDFFYSDSGMMAALIILGIVAEKKNEGKKLSELIQEIKGYANSGEINFKIENKKEAMELVRSHFENTENPSAFFDFDGYRLEFPDWWFNIRPSNTEPYLRLIVEAKTNALLNEKLSAIKEILAKFE
jgi:phosphomannomutase